jgi:hypothetical protein
MYKLGHGEELHIGTVLTFLAAVLKASLWLMSGLFALILRISSLHVSLRVNSI